MSRTPLPAGAVRRALRLSAECFAECSDRGLQEAINEEFDFLRTWRPSNSPLPSHSQAIADEALARGMKPIELVERYVFEFAATLPPVPAAKGQPGSPKIVTVHLSDRNDGWLVHHATYWSSDVMNGAFRALEFARTYGLSPNMFAAFASHLAEQGDTPRGFVLDLLRDKSDMLREKSKALAAKGQAGAPTGAAAPSRTSRVRR